MDEVDAAADEVAISVAVGSAEAPGEEGDGWGAPIVMLGEVGMTWFVPS